MSETLPTAAERCARFALDLKAEAMPLEVIEQTKLRLLDTLGCALWARSLGEPAVDAPVGERRSGKATAIGSGLSVTPSEAALVNGWLAHWRDYDSTFAPGICHTDAVVVPAALAVAEQWEADGGELLEAIVVGTEVAARLSLLAERRLHGYGFHPTSVFGIFGATCAVGRLRRFSEERLTSALGIAGSMAGGLMAFLDDGTATKPLHAGWAAHSAVLAVRLAAQGASGPPSVLEGRYGVFSAFVRDTDADLSSLALLGEEWLASQIAIKRFPVCHLLEGSLVAALELAADNLEIDLIERVEVGLPPAAIGVVAEPNADKLHPRSEYELKFSLPCTLALALALGEFDGDIARLAMLDVPGVETLAQRVRAMPHDEAAQFSGTVTLVMRDGSERTAHGEPLIGASVDRVAVENKFLAQAAAQLGEFGAGELMDRVDRITAPDGLKAVGELLARRQI